MLRRFWGNSIRLNPIHHLRASSEGLDFTTVSHAFPRTSDVDVVGSDTFVDTVVLVANKAFSTQCDSLVFMART